MQKPKVFINGVEVEVENVRFEFNLSPDTSVTSSEGKLYVAGDLKSAFAVSVGESSLLARFFQDYRVSDWIAQGNPPEILN